jgi:hypothetical protein
MSMQDDSDVRSAVFVQVLFGVRKWRETRASAFVRDFRRLTSPVSHRRRALVGDTRTPLPRIGYDSEYVRHGVSTLFMLNEPLRGCVRWSLLNSAPRSIGRT